jgi:SAM-dependent methyltransferase
MITYNRTWNNNWTKAQLVIGSSRMGSDPDFPRNSSRNARAKQSSRSAHTADICSLYAEKDYLDAYSEHTDMRVVDDPHAAVGGLWDRLGALQFEFLREAGLAPNHSLLDIGCGTLRAGYRLIRYLDTNCYTGIDISPKAIAYARALVHEEALEIKCPQLILCTDKILNFCEFGRHTFDFILAHSVFTHLMPQHIEECFRHIGAVMAERTQFFFTFKPAKEITREGLKDFGYPERFFHELAKRYSLVISDPQHEYNHPRQQRMLLLTRSSH